MKRSVLRALVGAIALTLTSYAAATPAQAAPPKQGTVILKFPSGPPLAEVLHSIQVPAPGGKGTVPALKGRFLCTGDVVLSPPLPVDPRIFLRYDGLNHLDAIEGLKVLNPYFFSAAKLDFDDEHFKHIIPFTGLRELNLKATSITDKSVPAIGAMSNLLDLKLNSTFVTGANFDQLYKLKNLQWIELTGCKLKPGTLSQLLMHLPNLHRLNIDKTGMVNTDTAGFANLKSLEILDIAHNPALDDNCSAAIAKLPKLQKLIIFDTSITDKSIPQFSKMPALTTVIVRSAKFWRGGRAKEKVGRISFLDHENQTKLAPEVFSPLH